MCRVGVAWRRGGACTWCGAGVPCSSSGNGGAARGDWAWLPACSSCVTWATGLGRTSSSIASILAWAVVFSPHLPLRIPRRGGTLAAWATPARTLTHGQPVARAAPARALCCQRGLQTVAHACLVLAIPQSPAAGCCPPLPFLGQWCQAEADRRHSNWCRWSLC
jgi:hypothetical protein